jgi:hypothetical protein
MMLVKLSPNTLGVRVESMVQYLEEDAPQKRYLNDALGSST